MHITLRAALEMLYEKAEKDGLTVPNYVTVVSKKEEVTYSLYHNILKSTPCTSAEEMAKVLERYTQGDEFLCARMFNKLAQSMRLDLSIKTAGYKSVPSIQDKIKRRRFGDASPEARLKDVKDVARLTVVSGDKELLEIFRDKSRAAFAAEPEYRKWEMTKTGIIKEVINGQINGIPSEILIVPREQARVAARISHKLYENVRDWDTYTEVLSLLKKENSASATETLDAMAAKKRGHVISHYNKLVKLANTLASKDLLPANYHSDASHLLASNDTNAITFDELKEGGKSDPSQYTPIFKEPGDIIIYRQYIHDIGKRLTVTEGGKKVPLLPMLKLDSSMSDDQLKNAINRLTTFTLLTHACYMQHAAPETRQIWAELAIKMNINGKRKSGNPGEDVIPESIIKNICDGAKNAQKLDFNSLKLKVERELNQQQRAK